MEIGGVRAFLSRHQHVALDTCIFIYQWEANPRYSPLTDHVFSSLDQSLFRAVTSTITMTELLVHPYRANDPAKVRHLFGLFSTYPNLRWISPTLETANFAAKLRAIHRLHTPDALQAATAIESKATALLTNDPIFQRLPDLDVLVLDDYV